MNDVTAYSATVRTVALIKLQHHLTSQVRPRDRNLIPGGDKEDCGCNAFPCGHLYAILQIVSQQGNPVYTRFTHTCSTYMGLFKSNGTFLRREIYMSLLKLTLEPHNKFKCITSTEEVVLARIWIGPTIATKSHIFPLEPNCLPPLRLDIHHRSHGPEICSVWGK